MRTVRNVLIIALLAVPIAFVPGGGDAAQGVLALLLLGFLAALGAIGFQLYRQNSFTLSALPDSRRALLFGALGVVVLMIVGIDELTETGIGTLAWIVLLAAAVLAIVLVWREAHSY